MSFCTNQSGTVEVEVKDLDCEVSIKFTFTWKQNNRYGNTWIFLKEEIIKKENYNNKILKTNKKNPNKIKV